MNKSRLINILAFVAGIVLLVWFIYYTGPIRLLDNLKIIGWGFIWVLLVFLGEVLLEVGAWYMAVPEQSRINFFVMFSASIAGSTMNALLPGGQAGEVLKGNLLSGLVPIKDIISSLTIYNFLYTETTLIVLGFFSFLCLVTGAIDLEIALALFGGIAVTSLILMGIFWWLYRGAITDILKVSKKIPYLKHKITDDLIKKGKEVDHQIRTFRHNRPKDYAWTMGLLIAARVFGIMEVWVILRLLQLKVSFITAAGIFTAGQLFYYITLFLPTRIGVLEGGAIAIFKMFGLDGGIGLTMEVVRRLRKFTYNLIGMGLFAYLGFYRRKKGLD